MQHEPAKEIWIGPDRSGGGYWTEMWAHREMLYVLGWRDLKVRYKQTFLGASWSVIRPVLTTMLFTLIFHKIAGMSGHEAIPYSIIVFSGTLAWQFFSNIFQESSGSLLGNMGLITKVYFPRMMIPFSTLVASVVDFLISFAVMGVYMWYRGIDLSVSILVLPFFMLMAILAGLGLGLFFAAVTVKYRDLRFLVPFIMQLGIFLSPVGYSSNVLPAAYRWVFLLNPMTGIIEGFRWCILGTSMNWQYVAGSLCISLFLFALGAYVFRRSEIDFADNI